MIKTIIKGASISLLCSAMYVNAETKNTSNFSNDPYIKVGAGVSFGNAKFRRRLPFDRRAPKTFPTSHIGIGYRVCNSFRTDLTLQYSEARYRTAGTTALGTSVVTKQAIRTHAAFVNGYYDANLHNDIAPYLTAGIGVGHNRTSNVRTILANSPRGASKTNFIWNVGAGAQFKVNKSLAIDFGYRYIHLGTARTAAGRAPLFNRNYRNPMRGHNIMGSFVFQL